MQRTFLSRAEKRVLRELRRGRPCIPEGMDNYTYFDAIVSLTDKGFVRSKTDYDEVVDVKFTPKGYAYIRTNPHLINPVNWAQVAAIAACIAALSTTIALFIACHTL